MENVFLRLVSWLCLKSWLDIPENDFCSYACLSFFDGHCFIFTKNSETATFECSFRHFHFLQDFVLHIRNEHILGVIWSITSNNAYSYFGRIIMGNCRIEWLWRMIWDEYGGWYAIIWYAISFGILSKKSWKFHLLSDNFNGWMDRFQTVHFFDVPYELLFLSNSMASLRFLWLTRAYAPKWSAFLLTFCTKCRSYGTWTIFILVHFGGFGSWNNYRTPF